MWRWKPQEVPAVEAKTEDAALVSAPAESAGHWQHMDDDDVTQLSGLEALIGPAHEFMGVFRINRQDSVGLDQMQFLSSHALEGLGGLKTLLCDPMALLDAREKASMHSFLASFAKTADVPDYLTAHCVVDCIQLHSGIATGVDDSESLALFYHLKFPSIVGGYETEWKLLYN